jgi:hypothetical protein
MRAKTPALPPADYPNDEDLSFGAHGGGRHYTGKGDLV